MAPTSLGVKNQSFPRKPARWVPAPPYHYLLHASLRSLRSSHTGLPAVSATARARFFYVKSLHALFPLPECPSTSFNSLFKCHCFRRTSLTTPSPSQNYKCFSTNHSPSHTLSASNTLHRLSINFAYYLSSPPECQAGIFFLPVFVHCCAQQELGIHLLFLKICTAAL